MRNNGESNPVSYLLGALLLGAGFYAFHVGPVYWGNLEAKEAVAEAVNIYILNGEEAAKITLLARLNKNADVSHYEMDDEGVESIKPGYGILEDNVTFTLDESAKKLTVRIQYDRIVEFAPLKKRKMFHLIAEKTGNISK